MLARLDSCANAGVVRVCSTLPGMLDYTLDMLGVPLEGRGAEPVISVEADSALADELLQIRRLVV